MTFIDTHTDILRHEDTKTQKVKSDLIFEVTLCLRVFVAESIKSTMKRRQR